MSTRYLMYASVLVFLRNAMYVYLIPLFFSSFISSYTLSVSLLLFVTVSFISRGDDYLFIIFF